MTEHKTHSRGKDFLIGFIPSLILTLIGVAPLFISEDLAMLNILLIIGAVLFGGAVIAIVCRRPFIGVGMVTVLVATPLLLIGSCFALNP